MSGIGCILPITIIFVAIGLLYFGDWNDWV